MAIDFPLASLGRYLWDHLSEIIESSVDRKGVSVAWTNGGGYEGFDNFSFDLRKFPGGQSNPTFLVVIRLSPPRRAPRVMTTEHRFVLRKKPASVKISSAHAVEREFRVLRALRDTDVPVPQVLLLCEDPSVIGTPFYIMEFVDGRVFSDAALPNFTREERAAAYASAADTLAKIHRVDFVSVGLGDYGRSAGGYLVRQVATLERVARKQAEDAGPIDGFDNVVKDLRELCAGVPDRVTLVHGDFRIDNLVFHQEEPRVIAVLDWELSTLGHPVADLANLCILHYLSSAPRERGGKRNKPSPLTGLRGLDLLALGIPKQDELVDLYRRAIGGGGLATMDAVELGLAFVFFKMAVIGHGVGARMMRGVASSESASQVYAMVPTMMNFSRERISNLRARENKRGERQRGGEDKRNGVVEERSRDGKRRPPPKAVMFDVGGVLSESPVSAILRFERRSRPRPLPPSYVGVAIAAAGGNGLFQRLEIGKERLSEDFLERFAEYLRSDHAKRAYVEYVERKADQSMSSSETVSGQVEEARRAVAAVDKVDVLELFRVVIGAASKPNPDMIAAVKTLRRRGFKIAAVSNDFIVEKSFTALSPNGTGARRGDNGIYSRLDDLCDAVLLSSVLGQRKPNRRIYELACEALGVSADEAVFVDDIQKNLVVPEMMGMQTVWVRPGTGVPVAIAQLEAITGVPLMGEERDVSMRRPAGKL